MLMVMSITLPPLIERLRGRLIVSVQADDGSPLRDTSHIVAMSKAALLGGAAALRLRSGEDIRAVKAVAPVPIIGLTKKNHSGTDVYITATPEEVQEVAQAGADIVAFDGTNRPRPSTIRALTKTAHEAGKLAMADISTFEEAQEAYAQGVDIVSTTMSGYTPYSPQQAMPDFSLMGALHAAGLPFVGEGRLNSPDLAARALKAGALCVVVGSAITRPDHVTKWFADGLKTKK